MIRLMLLRHAKSSWSDAKLSDRDRPLNGRGRKAARLVGEHVLQQGLVPQAILASPARRAQETLELVTRSISPERVETVDALYDFGDGTALLDAIHAHGGDSSPLMLVGHNPAMEGLADKLIGSGDKALREELALKYPTAGLAVIDFKGKSWARIAPGAGKLIAFVKPRGLEQDD
jgi:phosphohistidine phosphatase